MVFPTQTIVHRETRRNFPVVLKIKSERVRGRIAPRLSDGRKLRFVRDAEQERRIRVADQGTRNRIVELVFAKASRRIHIVPETRHVAEVTAELHGVAGAIPRQVVQDLKCSVPRAPGWTSAG